jgi:hypothetical protein
MKYLIFAAVMVAAVGLYLYLEKADLEDSLEEYAAERIHESLHSTDTGGGGAGGTSFVQEFAKGVGKKLLNKETGINLQ